MFPGCTERDSRTKFVCQNRYIEPIFFSQNIGLLNIRIFFFPELPPMALMEKFTELKDKLMEFKDKIVDAFKYLDGLAEDVEKGKPLDPVKCNATIAGFLFDVKGKFKVIAEKFEFIKEKLKGKPLAMLFAKFELKAQVYLEGFQNRWMTFIGVEQALLLNQQGILELFRNTIKQGKDDSATLYETIKSWAEEIMEGVLLFSLVL